MEKNLHAEHRERVRREFLERGFDHNTPSHKIVEMLLFYSIPRKDTNETAHELLNRFGSIKGILDAPVEQLKKVKGVGDNTVALFKLLLPVFREYVSSGVSPTKFKSLNEVGDFLKAKYLGFKSEVLAVTSLDAEGKFLGFDIISEGDTTSVELSLKKIIEVVLKRNASCVVISHNHPNSDAVPSNEDIYLTEKIYELLSNINIKLLDHIIIGFDDYISFVQSKSLKYIFRKN